MNNKLLYIEDDNHWINILFKNDNNSVSNLVENKKDNLMEKSINIENKIIEQSSLDSKKEEIIKFTESIINNVLTDVENNINKKHREQEEKMIKDIIQPETTIINEINNLYTDIENNNQEHNNKDNSLYKNIFTDTLKYVSVAFGVAYGCKLLFDVL